jgi:acetoin utilization deacetylase AcuC-like enzyme
VTTEGYRAMTQAMINLAERHCDGRLVVIQEGGYSETYGPFCTVAIVETLMGTRTNRPEPLSLEYIQRRPETNNLGLDAEATLRAVETAQAPYWPITLPT